ncbi:MAG: protein kinase, partial [Elusimicrobiota bacterium]
MAPLFFVLALSLLPLRATGASEHAHQHERLAASDQISLKEAIRLSRKEFDALRAQHEGREGVLQRITATESVFLKRLERSKVQQLSKFEVEHIAEMFDAQLDYGSALRSILEKASIPKNDKIRMLHELRVNADPDRVLNDSKLPAAVRKELVSAIEDISDQMMKNHDPNGSDVMAELHNAINEVFARHHRRPGRPGQGGDPGVVILPSPPGPHGSQMRDQFGADPSIWESSARERLFRGDRSGGLNDLDRAISLGGGVDAYALRGGVYMDQGDYAKAYADAQKAHQLNPDDKDIMGLLKSLEGRVPGLRAPPAASAQRALATGEREAAAQSGLVATQDALVQASAQKLREAERALSMGDLQEALALTRRALEINPNNAAAYHLQAQIFARMRDYQKAIAAARAGLAVSPGSASLLVVQSFAENRSKLFRDALASANRAIEVSPRNPYAYASRAHAYAGLGDRSSMLADINRAAALDERFRKTAQEAAALQLPLDADALFLFPGEADSARPRPREVGRGTSMSLVLGGGIVGGALLALGLFSIFLAPIKNTMTRMFSPATRRPSSAGGHVAGTIRGQYEILRQIGVGGMGTVFEGTDRSLGRRVAIKKMRDELQLNARERFVIEAKTVASLHHPNIVDVYAIADEGDDLYLIFEFVDGKTVHDLLQETGRLAPAESIRIVRGMASALDFAHSRGVIHRDMKPSNVMLDGTGQVKVMDFGIARMAKDVLSRYSVTTTIAGTPPYMAPEQEQGVVRRESDTYSLAICAYEMLTGKLPFVGIGAGMLMNKINMSFVPPSRAIVGLPSSLDLVFRRAFQKEPEKRHRSPGEFAAELQTAGAGSQGSRGRMTQVSETLPKTEKSTE